jgi:hypothetical protein
MPGRGPISVCRDSHCYVCRYLPIEVVGRSHKLTCSERGQVRNFSFKTYINSHQEQKFVDKIDVQVVRKLVDDIIGDSYMDGNLVLAVH